MRLLNIFILFLTLNINAMQQNERVRNLYTQLMIRQYLYKKTTIENIIDFIARHVPKKSDGTPLFYELLNIQTDDGISFLHAAVILKDYFFINWLIQHNANINVQNKDGNTPLHLAIKQGNVQLVKKLINHDANISLSNLKNETPLSLSSRLKTNKNTIRTLHTMEIRIAHHQNVYHVIEKFLKETELKQISNEKKDYDDTSTCAIV